MTRRIKRFVWQFLNGITGVVNGLGVDQVNVCAYIILEHGPNIMDYVMLFPTG